MAWIAIVLVAGIVSGVVRRDDEPSSGTSRAPVSNTSTTALDLSQALVDLSAFGYTEIPTAISGQLDLDKLLATVPAEKQAGVRAGFVEAGFEGGYARASVPANNRVVVVQLVLQMGAVLDNPESARSFAEGIAGASLSGNTFEVTGIEGASGQYATVTSPSSGPRPAVLVFTLVGPRIFLEMAIAAEGVDITPDDVIPIAQAQAAHR
jgi:hypothetical protein